MVASQATALGYLLHYFSNPPIWSGKFYRMIELALYSVCGGIRAVASIDVLQFIVLELSYLYFVFTHTVILVYTTLS
ncbi:hypothetical protein MHYMCMPSP_01031 [Hyalomma marginatum]|uniref:Uncharacterized protein n=1 Tax=Hyalomma marginatum TaxID=34627 RepID=A0A8S4C4G8_9ACAR|nr:hypothetical protein MHYMCMPASI_00161 [Hyalomma marginatum]CAG7597219.1 hypothetical protein MHYMCMPSP_01031 [Hyalomma marginatum]